VKEPDKGGVFIRGMRANPDHISITTKGRELLRDLGLREF
jgi:hypothetical protein